MGKKVKAGSTLLRLVVLGVLATGGVLAYQKLGQEGIAKGVALVAGKVQGTAVALNIDPGKILSTASKKLVEAQPIIENSTGIDTGVLGEVSTVTGQAQKIAEEAADKIAEQIKDLPRKEAAKMLRSACEQVISDLEK